MLSCDSMKTTLRRIGNSKGIILPKPLISQLNLDVEVELTIEQDAIVIRKLRTRARRGWGTAAKALAGRQEDQLHWPEFANKDDANLKW
jgi:antitoxin MazE